MNGSGGLSISVVHACAVSQSFHVQRTLCGLHSPQHFHSTFTFWLHYYVHHSLPARYNAVKIARYNADKIMEMPMLPESMRLPLRAVRNSLYRYRAPAQYSLYSDSLQAHVRKHFWILSVLFIMLNKTTSHGCKCAISTFNTLVTKELCICIIPWLNFCYHFWTLVKWKFIQFSHVFKTKVLEPFKGCCSSGGQVLLKQVLFSSCPCSLLNVIIFFFYFGKGCTACQAVCCRLFKRTCYVMLKPLCQWGYVWVTT